MRVRTYWREKPLSASPPWLMTTVSAVHCQLPLCWAPLGELSHSILINYLVGRVPLPTLLIEEKTGTERLSHFSGTVQLVGGATEAWNPGCRSLSLCS